MTRNELLEIAVSVVADHAIKTGAKAPAKTHAYIHWSGKSGLIEDASIFECLNSSIWQEAKSIVYPEFDMIFPDAVRIARKGGHGGSV